MGRKRLLPRYVQWRDGRPRWELGGMGGKRLRAAGFRSIDLKDEAGDWLSFERVKEVGRALNATVDTWRAGDTLSQEDLEALVRETGPRIGRDLGDFSVINEGPRMAVDARSPMAELIRRHRQSDHWKHRISAGSREAYKARGNVLDVWIGDVPVGEIRPSHGRKLFETLLDVGYLWHAGDGPKPGTVWHRTLRDMDRPGRLAVRTRRTAAMEDDEAFAARPAGYASAFYVMAYARELVAWARLEHDLVIENPFARLGLSTPQGRIRYVEPLEILHIAETADAMNMPELGDAAGLAVNTVQRGGDLIGLPWRLKDESRFQVTQEKTGEVIDCRFTKALIRRLEAAWARADAAGVRPHPDAPILPYRQRQALTKAWAKVREEAAKTMPSVADVLLHDLRDTGFTRLIESDCTLAQACNVSGHSLARGASIEKAYLAKRRTIADAAIDKVDIYMEQGGIVL